MSLTKKKSKTRAIKGQPKSKQTKQFVSDEGVYLHNDATSKMLKEWDDLVKKATPLSQASNKK